MVQPTAPCKEGDHNLSIQSEKLTPIERYEQKIEEYCMKKRVTQTALWIMGGLTTFALSTFAVKACTTVVKDGPPELDDYDDDNDYLRAFSTFNTDVKCSCAFGSISLLAPLSALIGACFTADCPNEWFSKYANPRNVRDLKADFTGEQIETLQKKYHHHLSDFYRIGIFNDGDFQEIDEMFSDIVFIDKNDAEYNTLDQKWKQFVTNTLINNFPNPQPKNQDIV